MRMLAKKHRESRMHGNMHVRFGVGVGMQTPGLHHTGKDFVYPDNYGEGLDTYLKRTQQKDEDGFWQSTNNETSGRKHANWLSMMTPRLTLARNLLRDDGVICISIDDNEVANLKSLCDEVIGAENFLGTICVVSNLKGRSDDKHFATAHNYLLAYARTNFETYGVPLPEEYLDDYPETDLDGNRFRLQGLRKRGAGAKREDRPNMFYPFYISPTDGKVSVTQSPIYTVEVLPQLSDGSDGRWRWGRDTAEQRADELKGQTVGSEKRWDVFQIDYAESGGESKRIKPKTLWMGSGFANESGTLELKKLLGKGVFDTPKPIGLVKYMLHFATANDKNDLILDFFAGSGTTGHAVMAQNAEDGGNRRYICVQLPEPLDEPVTLDDGVVCETIFDLTRERLKRAGRKLKEEAGLNAGKLDTGMRVFKLDSSNFTAWNSDPTASEDELFKRLEQLADHTVPGRSETDILWEMLLKMGLPMDLQLERFELEEAPGTTFIGVADRTRVISTQASIPTAALEALLEQDIPPSELVVLDSAFENDTARANIATLYKQRKDEDGKPVCNLKVV